MDASDLERAGLYDPEAAGADDRLALLRFLADEGATLEQIAQADAVGHLTGLAGDLALRDAHRFGAAELLARTTLDRDELEAIGRALGVPIEVLDRDGFTTGDVEAFSWVKLGMEFLGSDAMLALVRVTGDALARIADAAAVSFLTTVETQLVGDQEGDLALARANLDAVRSVDLFEAAIGPLFRLQLSRAISHGRRSRPSGRGSRPLDLFELAVGFVDLAGYTSLSRRLASHELASLVDDFEWMVHDVAARHDGRIVKLIGDGAMFVASDPHAVSGMAADLVASFPSDGGVVPRGGIAFGDVLARGGDYYGPVVNLAARLGEIAVPHEILVTAEAAAAAPSLPCHPAGRRLLRGFDEPVEVATLALGA